MWFFYVRIEIKNGIWSWELRHQFNDNFFKIMQYGHKELKLKQLNKKLKQQFNITMKN